MRNVAGVGSGSTRRTDYSNGNTGFRSSNSNHANGNNASSQSYRERVGFNQDDLVRATLEAREIPRMDATSEGRLARVNPQLANRIRLMAADLRAQGIDISVTSGLRTFAEQDALYAQGRTAPGSIVTNARGGQSLHNYGLAIDVVPLDANGRANWNASESTWQQIGAAGKRQGLEWGGDWTSFVDRPHFQMTGGKSISTLLSEYRSNGGNLPSIWADVNRNYPNVGGGTTAPPPTTPPASGNLQNGSRGAAVAGLQRDLTRLGYPLAADGIFGDKTDAAVRRFQRDHNLTVDGIVGPRTKAAIAAAKSAATLPVPTATLEPGSRGEQVKQLQNALVRLGFMTQAQMNTGPGVFGPRTDAALRDFQGSKSLEADGIYGPKSRAALSKALGGNGSAPTTATTPTNPTPSNPEMVSGARINDILRGTNLAGKGDLIARLARQYDIPAELALAMFRKEASFAQTGTLAERNNNPGNIRFVGQAGATSGAGGFARWNSMDEGIEAYFKLLDSGYRNFIDNGDWAGLVNRYAPPVENDSDLYARQIVSWMDAYRQQISV